MDAPKPAKHPVTTTLHGETRIDDYAWMRDDSRTSRAVLDHIAAENRYFAAMTRHTAALREQIYEELVSHVALEDQTAPQRLGDFEYYSRIDADVEYPIHCRRRVGGGDESVILDENQLAAGHRYHLMGSMALSRDQRYLAYTCNRNGSDLYTLVIRDLAGAADMERLTRVARDITWGPDGDLYYLVPDATQRAANVFRHHVGTRRRSDVYLLSEDDPTYHLSFITASSSRFLMVLSSSADTWETFALDLTSPAPEFHSLGGRRDGHRYMAYHHEPSDRFFILTNDQAPNFRVVAAATGAPAEWHEVIASDDESTITALAVYHDYLVCERRSDGLPTLTVHNIADGGSHTVSQPEPTYALSLEPWDWNSGPLHDTYAYSSNVLRFMYSSPVTPKTVVDYDMTSGRRETAYRQRVEGDFDTGAYTCERVFATADDGTPVPVSVMYRPSARPEQNRALLIDGYGSYGYALDAEFDLKFLPLLDRGVTVALAHVRGGGEYGERWRDAGRLRAKMNTFSDFIAATEHLIAAGYATPGHVVAMGRSAGGLLMGAITNMRPDLYCGIIAGVPFVDVVNTMLDESIPLTTGEFGQWGNPKVADDYAYIRTYSPYDNVTDREYPAMFVQAGLHDPRVGYWEPAKWVAKLRDHQRAQRPILLRIFTSGHYGSSGRFAHLKDKAYEWAFLLGVAGIT